MRARVSGDSLASLRTVTTATRQPKDHAFGMQDKHGRPGQECRGHRDSPTLGSVSLEVGAAIGSSLFPDFVSASPVRPSPSSPPFAPFASPIPPPSACTLPSSESCVVSLTICCPRLVARLVTRHRLVCPFARPSSLVLSLRPLLKRQISPSRTRREDGRDDKFLPAPSFPGFKAAKRGTRLRVRHTLSFELPSERRVRYNG